MNESQVESGIERHIEERHVREDLAAIGMALVIHPHPPRYTVHKADGRCCMMCSCGVCIPIVESDNIYTVMIAVLNRPK